MRPVIAAFAPWPTSSSTPDIPGTTQIVSQRTTLPIVSAGQNGPGTAVVTDQVFDAAGREIWSRDGDGFLRHTEHDAQTGAVVKSIVDVDTSRTSDFQNLPTGWATPAGGGLHLVTMHEVDRLGRITKATDPNGNITCTVYDDVNRSTRTYVGWNTATLAPTGPITVSRRDLSGTYTESLTYSAVPAVDAQGRPTGTEPVTNMHSLTRSLMNAAGQVIAVDRYTNLERRIRSVAVGGRGGGEVGKGFRKAGSLDGRPLSDETSPGSPAGLVHESTSMRTLPP